jgi:hypothetical protein
MTIRDEILQWANAEQARGNPVSMQEIVEHVDLMFQRAESDLHSARLLEQRMREELRMVDAWHQEAVRLGRCEKERAEKAEAANRDCVDWYEQAIARAEKAEAERDAAITHAGNEIDARMEVEKQRDANADLVERALMNITKKRGKLFWGQVVEVFATGRTRSMMLCERFGLDPDTGARLTERSES